MNNALESYFSGNQTDSARIVIKDELEGATTGLLHRLAEESSNEIKTLYFLGKNFFRN